LQIPLLRKRRSKGITQEELAEYMGVSRAAVSKWEKGQSYPDIALLPQLAAYFNVSMDELLGYEPQLTSEDIQNICKGLSAEITNKPFDEAMSLIREAIKKYYSCFPFLFQIAGMLMNHHAVYSKEQWIEAIDEAKKLFERITSECRDVMLARDALNMQALCCVYLGQHGEVFSLLGDSLSTCSPYEGSLIAKAYFLAGNLIKAKEVYQCDIYNFVFHLAESLVDYVGLIEGDFEAAKTALNRALEFYNLFNIGKLNPNVVAKTYLFGASIYCKHGDTNNALEFLEKYLDFCINKYLPISLGGDDFFTDVDEWLGKCESCESSINEQALKIGMLQSLYRIPAFEILKDIQQYKNIVQKLTKFVENDREGM